jgi:hypothetical protein
MTRFRHSAEGRIRPLAKKRWRIRPKALCVTNPPRLLAEIKSQLRSGGDQCRREVP